MAPFYDRDREQKELISILEHEPSLVYFVYGPINSGKTSLLTKVLGTLPEQIIPFYVNLRGRDVSSAGDFLNVLFNVDRKSAFDTAGEYLIVNQSWQGEKPEGINEIIICETDMFFVVVQLRCMTDI